MKKTHDRKQIYQLISETDPYKAEIYDGCSTRLYVRSDMRRARIEIDGTKWSGNTGGFRCHKIWVNGSDSVRKKLRAWRIGQKNNIKEGFARNAVYSISRWIED